jgi:glutamate-5-semialdehyde dehydrogenase
MTIREQVTTMAMEAKKAAAVLARTPTDRKNAALDAMAQALLDRAAWLGDENAKDLEAAHQTGLPAAMIDRLTLKPATLKDMARGLREVAALPDPVGKVTSMWRRPNGLLVGRMRIPLGVIGIIYESRPNVTADAAALCLKSGTAVILRGARRPSTPTGPSLPSSRRP